MAKVVSKSNTVLISQCLHQHRISAFPNKIWALHFGIPSFKLKPLILGRRISVDEAKRRTPCAQMSVGIIGKTRKWWEKGLQPNMKEVASVQDLVDSLSTGGDRLLVLGFFSPGCGGCKALHPKICQLAEMNPEVQFLLVNYEEHKSMCYSLGVHVLPFFRFYRGAHGRLCSFSCTNATIKKFKDALAKHTPDRCSLGPTKGLEDKELLALAANKYVSFHYTPKPVEKEVAPLCRQEETGIEMKLSSSNSDSKSPLPLPIPLRSSMSIDNPQDIEDTLVTTGR